MSEILVVKQAVREQKEKKDISLNTGHDSFILLYFEGLAHIPVTLHCTSYHASFDSM
jgi:hypothetical protein